VSLYNRLRSRPYPLPASLPCPYLNGFHNTAETVSTRYLCVSGASSAFPSSDWRDMTGLDHRTFVRTDDTIHFTARTDAWDPFIVYLVDPRRRASTPPSGEPSVNRPPHSPPHYPRPPSNAVPLSGGCPQPLYYNQPVVLQCLSSGIVSPVLIIRKVDNGTCATGGGPINGGGPSPAPTMPDHHSPLRRLVAPGEAIGERVSQLHKVAFEILENPEAAYDAPDSHGPSSFLSCMGDNVGALVTDGVRTPVVVSSSPPAAAADGCTPGPPPSLDTSPPDDSTSKSGKGRRVRKVSSVSGHGGKSKTETAAGGGGGRKRAQPPIYDRPAAVEPVNASSDSHNNTPVVSSTASTSSAPAPSPHEPEKPHSVWTVDCGEPAVWTIVGIGACGPGYMSILTPPPFFLAYATCRLCPAYLLDPATHSRL
jgi:recombining binding protein (suppressor of hairless)